MHETRGTTNRNRPRTENLSYCIDDIDINILSRYNISKVKNSGDVNETVKDLAHGL